MAITKPYTFVAGTKAKAVEVNTDFDVLYTEANRLGTEILNIDLDIQDINSSKANINGDATQRFQLANPENSYDGVNKNYLENSIANIKDYISGYIITKDTDNSIIVSAGSCYDSTFTTIMNSTGNITKENLNQSVSTTYYVYVISDNSGHNVDILIAQEVITPPLPSGYTLFRQIGSYTTDSDSKINIISYYGDVVNNDNNINNLISSIMPDYSKAQSRINGTEYIATADGWLAVYNAVANVNHYPRLFIGNKSGEYDAEFICTSNELDSCFCMIPVRRGQYYKSTLGGQYASMNYAFIPIN